jgi:hypothetical protein
MLKSKSDGGADFDDRPERRERQDFLRTTVGEYCNIHLSWVQALGASKLLLAEVTDPTFGPEINVSRRRVGQTPLVALVALGALGRAQRYSAHLHHLAAKRKASRLSNKPIRT